MENTWLQKNAFGRKDYLVVAPVVAVICCLFYSIAHEDPTTLPSSLTIGLLLWAFLLAPAVFYSPLALLLYPSLLFGGLFIEYLLQDIYKTEQPSGPPYLLIAFCWLTVAVWVRAITTWQNKRRAIQS